MKTKERIKRSQEMTRQEFVSFINWVSKFPTKADCAEALGFTRVTLDKLIDTGRGKPETIAKILAQMSQHTFLQTA